MWFECSMIERRSLPHWRIFTGFFSKHNLSREPLKPIQNDFQIRSKWALCSRTRFLPQTQRSAEGRTGCWDLSQGVPAAPWHCAHWDGTGSSLCNKAVSELGQQQGGNTRHFLDLLRYYSFQRNGTAATVPAQVPALQASAQGRSMGKGELPEA